MRKMMIATIMGITVLVVLVILAGWVSAQQTATTLPEGQDINVQTLVSGTTPPASLLLVRGRGHGGHRGFRPGFGLFLGYGGLGGYYGSYPYRYSVSPSEPYCVWNGYQYRCYDASGRILEE